LEYYECFEWALIPDERKMMNLMYTLHHATRPKDGA